LDPDSYLWARQEPDYVGILAREVAQVAGNSVDQQRLCKHVAARLLDRIRVRVAKGEECAVAARLLDGVDVAAVAREESLLPCVLARAEELDEDSVGMSREQVRELAGRVAERIALVGCWDNRVSDTVPAEIQPLHMSQVRESLGALIPAGLHKSLDKAAAKVKDVFGPVSGGSVLFMDGWRVSVRVEDALASSKLQEDALEFFLLLLRRLCTVLGLPVAIASKTVGKVVGQSDSATKVSSVMEGWRTVWNGADVRSKEELLMMVAVDDRKLSQDWMCVSVKSTVKGQRLGEATRLLVRIHDAAKRPSVARRVARNLDVLLRGMGAAVDGGAGPEVEFLTVPACPVVSQRSLCAFGLLMGHCASHAGTPALDVSSPAFVPDAGRVLRAIFSEFRTDAGARGTRDIDMLLTEKEACRAVFQKLGVAPGLVPAREPYAPLSSVSRVVPAQAGARRQSVLEGGESQRTLRVLTWNIAGGLKSDDAPSSHSLMDQQASVVKEVLRWERSYGCDVLALQECDGDMPLSELSAQFQFAGSAEAHDTRGFVHVYVRRGVSSEALAVGSTGSSVAVRVGRGEIGGEAGLAIGAVHLPSGDSSGKRTKIMTQLCDALCDDGNAMIVGDMNMKDDKVTD